MDMSVADRVHDGLTRSVTVRMSAEMLAAVDRVAESAHCTRDAVIREYIAESLPDGWLGTESDTRW